ncbi:MAG: hypothetical protein HW388_1088 [Dehalococcoidia bacterium]|nr:hypothetical protein [Dehalococcoidia bacterium]
MWFDRLTMSGSVGAIHESPLPDCPLTLSLSKGVSGDEASGKTAFVPEQGRGDSRRNAAQGQGWRALHRDSSGM